MKRLMILGAGVSQLPLIQKAKEMGHFTIVISRPGNYPGVTAGDHFYAVDTTNKEKIAQIARHERIDGICTTGTDVAIPSVGNTNDALGLNGVSYRAALLSANKLQMKNAFLTHGVRTADFCVVSTEKEARQAYLQLSRHGSSVIFKAVDGGASKGIIKVNDESQLDYAYREVKRVTKQPYFLVEAFIDGVEFGAQAFVQDGVLQFVMPHGDMMFYGEAGVPIGHYVPYELSAAVAEDVVIQLKRSIQALELDHCAMNADFILHDDQVFVLEIGARAGATCLPELVSAHFGFNYYEQMINAALRMPTEFQAAACRPCACELILSNRNGILQLPSEQLRGDPQFIDISFDMKSGDTVRQFKVGTDRIGQIIVQGESLPEVMQRLKEVKQQLTFQVIEA